MTDVEYRASLKYIENEMSQMLRDLMPSPLPKDLAIKIRKISEFDESPRNTMYTQEHSSAETNEDDKKLIKALKQEIATLRDNKSKLRENYEVNLM
jgi:hypothetical protein